MRNAESYKPAFNKAWNWVCRQFENGQLKPGMQLPSSQNLAKACGVSRTTMIDVFAILREKEIIEGSKRHRLKIVSIPTSLPPDETAESIPAEIVADTQSQTYNAILKDLLCGRWPPETALP